MSEIESFKVVCAPLEMVREAVDAYCVERGTTPESEAKRLRDALDAKLTPEEKAKCLIDGRMMLELEALHGVDSVVEFSRVIRMEAEAER